MKTYLPMLDLKMISTGGRVYLLSLIMIIFLTGSMQNSALAGEVPGLEQQVQIKARETTVAAILRELFGQLQVPVQVDENVRGTVNGDFEDTAREVFQTISASFHLTLYYDGAVAHVYSANDIARKIMYVPGAVGRDVVSNAQSLQLIDANNSISVSGAGLMVTGTQRFVEQIEELGDALQKGEPATRSGDTMRVFKLAYAWADDVALAVGGQEVVIPGVASLLRRLVEPGSVNASAPTLKRNQISPSQPGLRGEGLQSIGNSASLQNAPNEITNSRPSTSTSNTRIVADSRQNAVIIRDRPERMSEYEQLIRSLDIEPSMVEIEATIIDMNTERLRELGVNWRIDGNKVQALLGDDTNADTLLRPTISDVAPSGNGGIVSMVLGDETKFISRIRALETQGAARIVSKPHVITLSNIEALLDTTSTFFVRVAGREDVDLFNVSVGTTLRVTPHIIDNSGKQRIRLQVTIEDGSTSDRTVDQIPVVERSTINTQALVSPGESLLIGGLVREITANNTSKVPLLGDIPGIGALFRSNNKSSNRVERLFLITPRLQLRPEAGNKSRLDVPYLFGSESEVLSSNAGRLKETNQGLAARDERYDIVVPLPQGSSDVSLTRPDIEPGIRSSHDQAPALGRSLRERLPGMPEARPELAIEARVIPVPLTVPSTGRSVSQVSAQQHLDGDAQNDGWQSIPDSESIAIVEPGSLVNQLSQSGTSGQQPASVLQKGEWQVISQ